MHEAEKCILTNLCMIEKDGMVLVQDRKGKRWSGLAFPGGHIEPGESIVDSVIREVKEETGLIIQQIRLCGIKQFFLENGTRYLVFLFHAAPIAGKLRSSEEGEVFWIPKEQLQSRELAPFLKSTLEVMMNDDLSENFLLPTQNGFLVTNR